MRQQGGRPQGADMGQVLDGAAVMRVQGALHCHQVLVGMSLEYAAGLRAHGVDAMQHGVAGRFGYGNGQRGGDQVVMFPLPQMGLRPGQDGQQARVRNGARQGIGKQMLQLLAKSMQARWSIHSPTGRQ